MDSGAVLWRLSPLSTTDSANTCVMEEQSFGVSVSIPWTVLKNEGEFHGWWCVFPSQHHG